MWVCHFHPQQTCEKNKWPAGIMLTCLDKLRGLWNCFCFPPGTAPFVLRILFVFPAPFHLGSISCFVGSCFPSCAIIPLLLMHIFSLKICLTVVSKYHYSSMVATVIVLFCINSDTFACAKVSFVVTITLSLQKFRMFCRIIPSSC